MALRRLLLWGTFLALVAQSLYYRPFLPERVASNFGTGGEMTGDDADGALMETLPEREPQLNAGRRGGRAARRRER